MQLLPSCWVPSCQLQAAANKLGAGFILNSYTLNPGARQVSRLELLNQVDWNGQINGDCVQSACMRTRMLAEQEVLHVKKVERIHQRQAIRLCTLPIQ